MPSSLALVPRKFASTRTCVKEHARSCYHRRVSAEIRTSSWHEPLPWREMIAAVPADACTRGVFFNYIANELARAGHQEKTRTIFRHYPLVELMELEVRAATLLYPKQPLREGLRRLGRGLYGSLLSTTPGRVIVSIAGLDFRKLLTLASKAYSLSLTHGSCELSDLKEDSARYVLTDVHNFPDCTQVGIIEGAMEAYEVEGSIHVNAKTWTSADLLLSWRASRR